MANDPTKPYQGNGTKDDPATPSPTAPEGARRVDATSPHSSTARPAGDAVNGDTSTAKSPAPGSLGTGTKLPAK